MINANLNYNQSIIQCHDTLVEIINSWCMRDNDEKLIVDDELIATLNSTVRHLRKMMDEKM